MGGFPLEFSHWTCDIKRSKTRSTKKETYDCGDRLKKRLGPPPSKQRKKWLSKPRTENLDPGEHYSKLDIFGEKDPQIGGREAWLA